MIKLGLANLKPEDVFQVAVHGKKVSLHPRARSKMMKSYEFLRKKSKSGETIYGVNTGFGLLSNVRIEPKDLNQLQVNLIRSHSVGTGQVIAESEIRAMLLLRAQNLALGSSGVRPLLVERLIEFLNRGIHPVVFRQGSVGASGDLAPLSHLALPLIGEGEVIYQGKRQSTAPLLKKLKIKPIELGPKEGLALINGTQFMTALGTLSLVHAEYLAGIADLAGALSLEALKGTTVAFDPLIHQVRGQTGQIETAARLMKILAPRGKHSAIALSHEDCGRVQDPYSLRCIPQVHGMTRDSLKFVREIITREINAVTDNPLVFPEENKVISGGNFHGQYVSMALDFLSIAIAELASISEQRMEKLINPALSGLPAFLAREGGLNSGFMIIQVAAASIVSENKTLCHPASVDSIPTSADKEDHVSMGAWSSVKCGRVISNVRRVLAMELMAGITGIEFHRPLKSSPFIESTIRTIQKRVPPITKDRIFSHDIQTIEMILENRLIEVME